MTSRIKHLYGLLELTDCPQRGEILRTERMTDTEARHRNASMGGTVIKWQRLVVADG